MGVWEVENWVRMKRANIANIPGRGRGYSEIVFPNGWNSSFITETAKH